MKRRTNRNRNRLRLTNQYGFGAQLKNAFSSESMDNALNAGIGAIGSTVGKLGGNLISGGKSSGVGNAVGNITGAVGSAISNVNPILGSIVSVGGGLIGGGINSLFGAKLNQENINEINQNIANAQAFNANAGNFDALSQLSSSQPTFTAFTQDDIGSDGVFSSKVKKLYNQLNQKQQDAMAWVNNSLVNNANNLVQQQAANLDSNYKAFGGTLSTHGADFSNGYTIINNGGTHEQNPYEGIQVGVDQQGIPNLVEEGEVIFNDYVFSNRIKIPETIKKKYKLGSKVDMTFADAAKFVGKESEERPNDPISKRGLEEGLIRLAMEQENMRNKKNTKNRKYGNGGPLLSQLSMPLIKPVQLLSQKIEPINVGLPQKITARPLTMPKPSTPSPTSQQKGFDATMLRYAPVIGAGIGLSQSLFNGPDYSNSDTLLNATRAASTPVEIGATPIGNYLTYTPLDFNYQANRMAAQAGATRRAIMDQSGGNRATAIGSLLAADYNSQIAQADALRQDTLANIAQRQQVEAFNRDTNKFNTELALKAAMANQEARAKAGQIGLSGIERAMAMRDAIDANRGASISANLTNLFDSLGDIGREAFARNMINDNDALYYGIDSTGRSRYKRQKGGFLNRKKK